MNKKLHTPLMIAIALHGGVLMLPVEGESNQEVVVEEAETTKPVEVPLPQAVQNTAQVSETPPSQTPKTKKKKPAVKKTPPKPQVKPTKGNQQSQKATGKQTTPSPRTPQPQNNPTNQNPLKPNGTLGKGQTQVKPGSNTTPPPSNDSIPTIDIDPKEPSLAAQDVNTANDPPETKVKTPPSPLTNQEFKEKLGKFISPITSTIQYPLHSFRNPYSDFPLYQSLDPDKTITNKTLSGSLGLLKPEVEYRVFVHNTTQEIDAILSYYREIFEIDRIPAKPFQIASVPTLSGDGYGVYEITVKDSAKELQVAQNKGKAEPHYLHLVQHKGRTISLLLPQAFSKADLMAATAFPRSEQVQLDRILTDLQKIAIADPVKLNELQNADLYQNTEQYKLYGKTNNPQQLQVELEQQFVDSLFLTDAMASGRTELAISDPNVMAYTITSGAEFTQYFLLVPTKTGEVALVIYQPLKPEEEPLSGAIAPEGASSDSLNPEIPNLEAPELDAQQGVKIPITEAPNSEEPDTTDTNA